MSRLTAHATMDTPADDICELYELPRNGCYHCRTGHLPPPDQPQAGRRDRRGDADIVFVTSFASRWDGWCANPDCGRHFTAGTWIHRTNHGDYYCSEC